METLIDAVLAGFVTAIAGATSSVAAYGMGLLGVLALIAYFFRFAPYVTSTGAGLGDALAGFMMIIVGIGITLWLLVNLVSIGDALYQAAITIGLQVTGTTVGADQLRNPSFILSQHKAVTKPLEDFILNHSGSAWAAIANAGTLFGFWLAEMLIYASFVIISLHMAIIVIEFYFALLAATVLLPAVVFTPSAFIGEWVIGWVLGGTVRVMMVGLVVSIAVPLFATLAMPEGGADPRWVEVVGVVAAAVLFAALAVTIPGRAANLVGHGLGLSWSSVSGAAAAGVGGVMRLHSVVQGTSQLLARRA